MKSIRRSAMSLVRCLTVVSLLLSVAPPSTFAQAAPVRAPAPVQVNTPRPTPVPTSEAPTTPTTFASPLAPAGPTPTPAPVELAARPLLTVSAEPDSVAPGDVVTFSLTLFNPTSAPMSGQVLNVTLPDGLRWIPGQAGLTFDAPSRRLTAGVGQLAPGQGVTLTAQLRAQPCEGTEPSQGSGCPAMLEVEARSGDTVLAQGLIFTHIFGFV